MPLLSIIVPLHDKGAYIRATIESVQAQDLTDWEMIVVENGSRDNGPQQVTLAAGTDSRITLLNSSQVGPGHARNLGLGRATGRWVLFLDADDLVATGYFSERLAAAESQPEAQIIAGPWTEFEDRNDSPTRRLIPAGWNQGFSELETAAFAFAPWCVHAALVRRTWFSLERQWQVAHDGAPIEDCPFWFRLIHGSHVAWASGAGALYRRLTPNSRSDTNSPRRSFAATQANLASNALFLAQQGTPPSPAQAATAVRVLRAQLAAVPASDAELRSDITTEIRHWLRRTARRDPRMLFWRVYFSLVAATGSRGTSRP